MKRRVVWLMAVAALLVSCGRQGEIHGTAQMQPEIVLITAGPGEFWSTVRMGAEAAAKELGVKLTITAPEQEADVGRQVELVNEYLAYGVDGIVIAAGDYQMLADSAAKADRQGVPVVAIESEIDSPKVRSFVGIDNYEAGRQAARKMADLSRGSGGFLILGYQEGARNAEERERGIRDEWTSADSDGSESGMAVVETITCGLLTAPCSAVLKERLTRMDTLVNGIVALDARAAVDAAETVRSLGLAGLVRLIGFDNSPEELEWLQEGVIQATVIQNPFSIGYLGVKTVLAALNRETVEKRIDTGTKVIDGESMFWSDNQKMLFPFVQ